MFADLKDSLHIKWESAVEWYILKVDSASVRLNSYSQNAHNRLEELSNHQQHPRRLLQLTLIGIILTFTVLLFSCQTAPRPVASIQPRKFDAARPERELDQLYIRRNDLTIKNTESGSSTGSIWADAREPRSLLTDASPSKEGQTITIKIPEELQFDPRSATADGNTDPKNKDKSKSTAGKDSNKAAEPVNGIKLTDPDEASPSQRLAQRPIKSFKMQIVGFEPSGDVYLRGIRKYTGANGEENSIMVLAKVPRRLLSSFELDARELTDVAVNEDMGGRMREYSASGWDDMVSRRLAGFTPDLNSENATLDALRDEIKTAQSSLRDQAKANEMERERIRKERNRLSAANGGSQPAGGNAPAANAPAPQPAQSAPAAEGKEGDK
ncbi:MAG: hypothetical protein RLZZ488_2019 [Pseudomonadota bacterium]